jgi:hypothetical protein
MKIVVIRAWLGCDPVSETCRTKSRSDARHQETAESFAARRRTRAHHPSTSAWTSAKGLWSRVVEHAQVLRRSHDSNLRVHAHDGPLRPIITCSPAARILA